MADEQDLETPPTVEAPDQAPAAAVTDTPAAASGPGSGPLNLFPGGQSLEPDATAGWALEHVLGSWATVQYIAQPDHDVPYFVEGRYWFHHGRQDCPPDVAERLFAQPGFLFVRDVPIPTPPTP